MNEMLTPKKMHMILYVSAIIAVVLIVAVLVFQIIEFQFYRQAPSIWPPAVR